jgi:hypothetical protein
VQRGLFDDLGSSRVIVDDDEPHATSTKSASSDGFNLHAAVRIGADDDVGREKLVRYCARPPFSLERLSVLADGRIAYAIKTARRGATHRILTPIELLARIAAITPPPRHPFLRYHGVLAPAAKWRKEIVPRTSGAKAPVHACREPSRDSTPSPTSSPAPLPSHSPSQPQPPSASQAAPSTAHVTLRSSHPPQDPDPHAITEAHRSRLHDGRLLATSPRLDWATLLARTYAVDVLVCPRCGGAARVVAAVTDPRVIRQILAHLREPPARAPPSGAREPLLEV